MARSSTCVMLVLAAVGLPACGGHAKPPPRATARATARPEHRPKPRFSPAHAAVATRGRAARRAAIPILMYHVISAAPASAPYPQLWVAPERFAAEMRALHRAGYHAITLAEAVGPAGGLGGGDAAAPPGGLPRDPAGRGGGRVAARGAAAGEADRDQLR